MSVPHCKMRVDYLAELVSRLRHDGWPRGVARKTGPMGGPGGAIHRGINKIPAGQF
jgi:hypothetical protein